MAGHTLTEQRRNAPVGAFRNGTLAVSACLSKSDKPIAAEPWSQPLPESKDNGNAPKGKTLDAVKI